MEKMTSTDLTNFHSNRFSPKVRLYTIYIKAYRRYLWCTYMKNTLLLNNDNNNNTYRGRFLPHFEYYRLIYIKFESNDNTLEYLTRVAGIDCSTYWCMIYYSTCKVCRMPKIIVMFMLKVYKWMFIYDYLQSIYKVVPRNRFLRLFFNGSLKDLICWWYHL